MNNTTHSIEQQLKDLPSLSPAEDRLQAILANVQANASVKKQPSQQPVYWLLAAACLAVIGFGVTMRPQHAPVVMAEISDPSTTAEEAMSNNDEMELLLATSQQLEQQLADMNQRRASLRQLHSFERARLPLMELDARFSQQRNPEILRERIRVMQDVQTGQFDAAFYLVD
jgi:hypothetical protein